LVKIERKWNFYEADGAGLVGVLLALIVLFVGSSRLCLALLTHVTHTA